MIDFIYGQLIEMKGLLQGKCVTQINISLWHLANVFSLVYFSVVVCLRGLYHHILLATARALCQGQCTPHARFPLTKGGGLISGSPLLGRRGGVVELVLGSVFIIELDTGLAGIYFHRYYTEYDVCHKQNT